MAGIGVSELVVAETAIDVNGHVNNVQYIQWMQDAAMAHSAELGWPQEQYAAINRTWVIRSHNIEYRQPAFLGEGIRIYTWVADFHKIRSLRKFKFCRQSDGAVLAVAETLFVFCDHETGRPQPIPEEVRRAYTIIAPADEP